MNAARRLEVQKLLALRRARRAQAGALYVEALISLPVVLYFFLITMQLADLMVASLIVQRAARAAARSAAVVGPDQAIYYGGQARNDVQSGARSEVIRDAAWSILRAHPRFAKEAFSVSVEGAAMGSMLSTKLTTQYRCYVPWLNAVCGGSASRPLTGKAMFPYQDANMDWDL